MTETRTLNPYTRKIDKEYQRLLFKSALVTTDVDGKQNFTISPSDIQDAKDYLLTAMFGMTQDEVGELGMKEYETLSKQIDKLIEKEKSGSTAGNTAKVSKVD